MGLVALWRGFLNRFLPHEQHRDRVFIPREALHVIEFSGLTVFIQE
jgi:hypothetical protein